MNNNQTQQSLAILKAIAYTENGGKPNVSNPKAGKSGEAKSVLQFLPATWKDYSKQVTGKDNTPLTPENEMTVAYGKINGWLNDGYTPEQIFSMWNSGRPNAYKENVKGVNKSGVAYNTPAYVKKASNYLSQFEDEDYGGNTNQDNPIVMKQPQTPPPTPQTTPAPQTQPGLLTGNPMKAGNMKQPLV